MHKKTPLPDKLYFKIGEVSKIARLPAYVLRFWENEFACVRPKRSRSGQRLYRRSDVEIILEIRHLLHERRFTIEGARQYLSAQKTSQPDEAGAISFAELKNELLDIRKLLDED